MRDFNFHEPADIINRKFGDLKVIRQDKTARYQIKWECRCWCGNWRVVTQRKLLSGEVTMCIGCEARAGMEKPIR